MCPKVFRRLLSHKPTTASVHGNESLVIDVNSVSVVIDDTQLLEPTSLAVAKGRILSVRGSNGSGKTTLLRTVAGLQRTSAGALRICGEPANEKNPDFRRRVAAFIDLPPLAPDLTVFDHLALVATTWKPAHAPIDQHVEKILGELKLTSLRSRFPHELSSGQTQLFALALVLTRPSEVLILDEPERRLDPSHIESVAQALLARRRAGTTMLIATHSDQLSNRIADQTLRLGGTI